MNKKDNPADEWLGKNFSFFSNTTCEYFPCHADASPDDFNCIFCYCPLHRFGDKCGGNFKYLRNGAKDCSDCLLPHRRENYGHVTEKLTELLYNFAEEKDSE